MGGAFDIIEDVVDTAVDIVEDVVEVVVDIIETVVEIVVDVVEAVVDFVAELLGFTDQTVTLFEVHNQPLFSDQKDQTSLTTIVLESLLQNIGVTENILYYATQRNLKTDLKKLVNYIDDGNYIENFASIQSAIFYVNSDEIDSVITSIEGAPITTYSEKLFALSIHEWVSYWMYANNGMSLNTFKWTPTISGTPTTVTADVGNAVYNLSTNDYTLTSTYGTVTDTTPAATSPAASTFTPGTNETEVYFTSIALDKTRVPVGGTLRLTLQAAINIVADDSNFTIVGGTLNSVTNNGTEVLVDVDVTAAAGEPVTVQWAGITGGTDTSLNISESIGTAENFSLLNNGNPYNSTTPFYSSSTNITVTPDTKVFADWESDTVYVESSTETVNTYDITVPTKPTGLHYIIRYTLDSDPTTNKMFVYKVGTGLYSDLDDPNTTVDIDAANIKAIPPIPLRVNNTNYTSRPQAEVDKIEGIGKFVGLDVAEVLDAVMTDPSVVGNENKVDHVYLNFGIRLADTSHPAKKYMYNVCQNLFPSQAVTKAVYDAALATDAKPQNNIIITAQEYRYAFQWSYITYHNFTLAEINADPNSDINGLYYSDLSKFDASNNLQYVYFVSSRQGTYNVQYITDSPSDVDQFIAGTLPSEANYKSEAAGWMQSRSKFRWTSGVIYESDGTTVYRDDYIRPTLVYEKQGNNLKLINSVPESVTVNQEISYYRCAKDGMTGYTIKAPIGAFRVVDAATGEFKMVKFNLANENDLMFPLLFDKVEGLSQAEVTQVFTAAAHVSMYVAHVEVIEVSFWTKLLVVIVFIIIIYFAWQFATEFMAAVEAGTTAAFIEAAIADMAKQMIIRYIAQEIAGDNAVLAALLMVGGQFVDFGFGTTMDPSALGGSDYATLFAVGADGMSNVYLKQVDQGYQDLAAEQEAAETRRRELTDQLTNARKLLGPAYSNPAYENFGLYTIETAWTTELTPQFPESYLETNANIRYEMPYLQMESSLVFDHIFNFEERLYA